MLKSNSHKKQEVHFMDITANNKHRFATKWMNTETVKAILDHPLIPEDVHVSGFIIDSITGALTPVVA